MEAEQANIRLGMGGGSLGSTEAPDELAVDDRVARIVERELHNAHIEIEVHGIELERNQRVARACEAALKQLSSSDPVSVGY